MENRITSRMESLKARGGKSLSVVVNIGDPDLKATFELIGLAERAGIDVIEVGIPMSAPFLDSQVMRESMLRSLAFSRDYALYLDALHQIREKFPAMAFEVMIYHETVMEIGLDRFCQALVSAQMDSVLVSDGVFKGEAFLRTLDAKLLPHDIFPIRFVPHPFNPDQLADLKQNGRGFIVVQTKTAVDGKRDTVLDENRQTLNEIRAAGVRTPLVFAYGIKTPAEARKCIALGADGVLIGTAFLEAAHRLSRSELAALLRDLRAAVAPLAGPA